MFKIQNNEQQAFTSYSQTETRDINQAKISNTQQHHKSNIT